MNGISRGVERLNLLIGRSLSWLTLVMVLVYFLIVLLRYWFDFGSIAMQESVTYLHAMVFMGAAAWTLQADGHVRVDIFYGKFSNAGKAVVNLFGSLFLLLPFAGALLLFSWEYVGAAWARQETSAEPGGLPWLYLLKTLILVMAVQLILQAVAEAVKAWQILRGQT